MNQRKSTKDEVQLLVNAEYQSRDERGSISKPEHLGSHMFNDKELLESPNDNYKTKEVANKFNGMSAGQMNQLSSQRNSQFQSFTDREEHQPNYLFSKTFLKETDRVSTNLSPNTSNPMVKVNMQKYPNTLKTGQGFLKSPMSSQMSSNQNIQIGDLYQNSESDSIKLSNNQLPHISSTDQPFITKLSPYFSITNINEGQFSKNQLSLKNSIFEMLPNKISQSQPNILISPDFQKTSNNIQKSQQKFFHIKQQSSDGGFLKDQFSNHRHSSHNLEMQQTTPLIGSQIKKRQDFRSLNDKKEDKLNILVILNQINNLYEKDGKISYNLCILIQKLIGKLSKQDNMYGDQMKVFFDIIQQMIICEDEIIVNRIKQFKSLKKKKQTLSNIPAYFQCVQLLSEEIEYLTANFEQNLNVIKQEKEQILEQNFNLRDKIQIGQTEALKNAQTAEKAFQVKLGESRKQVEELVKQQDEQLKEMGNVREQLRQAKQETEKQMRNNNNLNYIIKQNEEKINELNALITGHQKDIQLKEGQVSDYQSQVQWHQEQSEQLTPRPKLDGFFRIFEYNMESQTSFSVDDKGLTTQEKLDYIQYKIQEKFIEPLNREEDKKKSIGKNKSSLKLKQVTSSKEPKDTPPKSRIPVRKASNLKQSNSIQISSSGAQLSSNKNFKELFTQAISEVKRRVSQKLQFMEEGISGAEQIDVLTHTAFSQNNSIANNHLSNIKSEQKLSNFSKSMRSIARKTSNGNSIQRSNSKATLASLDSMEIGERMKFNRKSDHQNTNMSEPPIANFNEENRNPNFKRKSNSRASTYLSKKKTVIIEENKSTKFV